MAMPIPTLETDRLILRAPAPEDFPDYVRFCADEETMRFIGGVMSPAVAWRSWCVLAGSWTIRGFSMLSVIEKSTGRWVGRMGPWQPEGWPGTEVAWGLSREARGQGYATEGAAACVDYAFETLGWDEVIHTIEAANTASQNVARRVGSTLLRSGRLPDPYDLEVDVWGQSREAWSSRR